MANRAFQTVPTAFSSAPGLHLRPCQLWPTTSAAKGRPVSSFSPAHGRRPGGRIRCSAAEAEETLVAVLSKKKAPTTVKAIVTVDPAVDISLSRGLDDITDLLGKSLYMELVSNELDPRTGAEKKPVGDFAHRVSHGVDEAKYVAEFLIPKDFGEIGALLITNEHHKEMFVKNIVLSLAHEKSDHVTIDCQTWIHSKFDSRVKRVFFTNKSYLPSETPSGLQELRKKELELVRGNGKGERKPFERIYDYDVYNDLGDPDSGEHLARPVLGGNKKFPYPRRCRTGRPPTKKDPKSEERSGSFYVPRDEAFAEVKQEQFTIKTLKSALHALLPYINSADDDERGFPFFTAIDSLFSEGVSVNLKKNEGWGKRFVNAIPRIVKAVSDVDDIILRFETPELMDRDKFAWFSDDEFSRQTLAGINPLCIELLREFPIVSKLDPEIYGPAESAITKEIIERQIGCFMTVEQALKEKKLFILDYHDVFLPYVHKIRTLENTTLYGSRTIFFLTPEGTLRPIAIELTRPANYPLTKQWRHVFTHLWDATSTWLWRIAKAHVGAHDSGYHQLVSHWLRTHCAAEPYVIAANRQAQRVAPHLPPPGTSLPIHHGDQRTRPAVPRQRRRHHRELFLSWQILPGALLHCLRPSVALRHGGAPRRPHPKGNGRGRPDGGARPQADHQGLPLCRRWPPHMVRHQGVGDGLRCSLLPNPGPGGGRPGAAGLVVGGPERGPRRQEGRTMVAGPRLAKIPRRRPHHHHLDRLRPPRGRQFRPVPLRRLLPEPTYRRPSKRPHRGGRAARAAGRVLDQA
ncbi:hypothetical protein HPP92_023483 [Vanilla planifolia]|uniref:Lipoxygenase n=1 Tax=Vanilla planifolia TaxID=51239 RepID=A0A835UC23_VANPL|nr:hypothetical protein HPP92_023483 [Vanilla planifolia]